MTQTLDAAGGGRRSRSSALHPQSSNVLKSREVRFVGELLLNPASATRAAIKAGYPERSAYSTACELLKKPEVQEELDRRRRLAAAPLEISAADVVRRVAAIATTDPRTVLGWYTEGEGKKARVVMRLEDSASLTPDQAALIKGFRSLPDGRVELVLHNQLEATRLLGEFMGMLKDGDLGAGKVSQDGAAALMAEEDDALDLGGGATLLPSRESDASGD